MLQLGGQLTGKKYPACEKLTTDLLRQRQWGSTWSDGSLLMTIRPRCNTGMILNKHCGIDLRHKTPCLHTGDPRTRIRTFKRQVMYFPKCHDTPVTRRFPFVVVLFLFLSFVCLPLVFCLFVFVLKIVIWSTHLSIGPLG